MKVENIALPILPAQQPEELPIINAEQIKSILYLGIRGEVKLEMGGKHAVDMYA
jgi:hypothetical protein